jgi:hypothetical protein
MEEAEWTAKSTRRFALIDKEMKLGLNAGEEAELARLDDEADRYLDRVAPLPVDHIKEFQAAAEHILNRKNAPAKTR